MNYLAHTWLSRHTGDALVGGMLGDFVKGRIDGRFSEPVCAGIHLHRAIDRYTDNHPLFRASRARISTRRRRFAGIMVDVFYDHFLARHWGRYAARPLPEFTSRVYGELQGRYEVLPERLQRILPRMRRDDWLASYGELAAVDAALNGIARRFRRYGRAQVLSDAVVELEQHYAALEQDFLAFFPEAQRFSDAMHARLCRAPAPGGLEIHLHVGQQAKIA